MYRGRASACGAATVINAIAMWKGSAFAIDLHTHAEVRLSEDQRGVEGEIEGGGDTGLIELCVEKVLEATDKRMGGRVRTWTEIPMASGLKSSSAAANATVLATLDALGVEMSILDAVEIGVSAARESGVTITGAYDDACASALGGLVFTDNRETRLITRREIEHDVLVFVPDQQAFSADTDVEGSRAIAPLVEVAWDVALDGDYMRGMTLNGFLYCGALEYSARPMMSALQRGVRGVSLSGTGPSYVAIGPQDILGEVEDAWKEYEGRIIKTKTNNIGARSER